MNAHPELIRATVLAALASSPDWTKRQLVSKDAAKRERAEDVLTAKIVVALARIE